MIIKYFLINYHLFKDFDRITLNKALKRFSDVVISDNFQDFEVKRVKYYKTNWIDIDLFLYWSKMLRISKKISLKSLAIQLNYPVVQELPFPHNKELKMEDLPILRHYNSVHDIGILRLLEEKLNPEIKLRANIRKDYNLDCYSWDAIKIASEALLDDYCLKTYDGEEDNLSDFNKYKSDIRKIKHTKTDIYFKDILSDIKPNFELKVFQDFYSNLLNQVNTFSHELVVDVKNTLLKISYGIGGIHSVNNNETYKETESHCIITSDIASLYPTNIINYKLIRYPEVLEKYSSIKDERIIAKKNKEKNKDTFFKLILNGTSGLIDQEYSWLYYPEGAMKLRLIGQIILTKLIEKCIINNWKVVSANTDGIECIIPRNELEKYYEVVSIVEKMFNVVFEHDFYKQIIYYNVNNYIAESITGKLKKKGLFKYGSDIPLGDSVDMQVISKCLEYYYVSNISPDEVLNNPEKYNLHIYDFCCSNKISKDYTVYHNGKVQQQLNRYYFSKNSPYLYKKKKNKTTMEHVNVGQGVTLFNEYIEKPWNEYNIDTSYYLSEVNAIIQEISNYNQMKLF